MKKLFILLSVGFAFTQISMADRVVERSEGGGEGRPVAVQRTRVVRRPGYVYPNHHEFVARNSGIVHSMRRDSRVEIVVNRTYWHTSGGVRYAHMYHGGVHWYGFYHGRDFYWTRYYGRHWWWYDPDFNHWVFWANGNWWWNGPSGVLYVYEDDSYYPYNAAPVQAALPADAPSDSSFTADEIPPPPPTAAPN